MIDPIRTFLLLCPYFTELKKIGVDFLSKDTDTASIETIPTQEPVIEKYLDGSSLNRLLFHFKARFNYADEVANNIANINFFENLSEWVEEQNNNDKLPTLGTKKYATKLRVLSNAYLFDTPETMDNAEYAIQFELEYMKEV